MIVRLLQVSHFCTNVKPCLFIVSNNNQPEGLSHYGSSAFVEFNYLFGASLNTISVFGWAMHLKWAIEYPHLYNSLSMIK